MLLREYLQTKCNYPEYDDTQVGVHLDINRLLDICCEHIVMLALTHALLCRSQNGLDSGVCQTEGAPEPEVDGHQTAPCQQR